MRVIIIGTTGVNMRALATSLDAFHKRQGRGRLGIYFVEDELRKEIDWVNFLDGDDYFWQERVWREAAAKAIGRAEEEAPEYALLFMNLPYFRKSRFFPAVDIAILRAFRPDMLLTLIEEAHVIWRRIQIREEREKTGARLRLKDVFAWRTASRRHNRQGYRRPQRRDCRKNTRRRPSTALRYKAQSRGFISPFP